MVSRRKLLLIFCAACGTFSLLCVWSYFIRMEKFYWEASKLKIRNIYGWAHGVLTCVHVVVVAETTENSMYNHGESPGGGGAAALRSHHIRDNLESFDDNLIVIYNRVPKTGSTSFVNLAYDLCKRNHFYVLHINITANMHVLSLNNQVREHDIAVFILTPKARHAGLSALVESH